VRIYGRWKHFFKQETPGIRQVNKDLKIQWHEIVIRDTGMEYYNRPKIRFAV
jgi:hypothetical protein